MLILVIGRAAHCDVYRGEKGSSILATNHLPKNITEALHPCVREWLEVDGMLFLVKMFRLC